MRFVLTGGTTIGGLSFDPKHGHFFILLETPKPNDPSWYENGAKLITHEHIRAFSDIKTTNYITAVSLQGERKQKGAIEILYTFGGNVLEGTTSNFFMIKDEVIITPKDNILIGITRNFVIKLAKKEGYKVIERDIDVTELREADEAFITASNKEIVPIVKIDTYKIGHGKVGENTKLLMEKYGDVIKKLS